jgi:hypothetical protein
MTLEELESQRATAGAAYAAVTTAYWNAYIELHAIEHALENRKYRGVPTLGFGPAPDAIAMRHQSFTPAIIDVGGAAFDWAGKAQNRMLEILANDGVV